MSIPQAAVTSGGSENVRDGSTTASTGRSRACEIPVLTLRDSTSSTQIVVDSDPVPAVVGTAISGFSGRSGARPPPTGALM